MKEIFTTQSVANEQMAQVINPSTLAEAFDKKKQDKKKKKPVKRNPFTVAKQRTVAKFKKVEFLVDDIANKKDLFRKCLNQVLEDMDGYNILAFQKDLAMHMAFLLNDRRFIRTCWDSNWSLFEVSQQLAWAKATDFQQIRDLGLNQVHGFDVPGIVAFELKELSGDLKAQGFDEKFWTDDPYTIKWKEKHPGVKRPTL